MRAGQPTPRSPDLSERKCRPVVMHRGVLAFMRDRGVRITSQTNDGIVSAIRTRLPLMTLREQDGRLHPMALQMTIEGSGRRAYLSATECDGSLLTTIVVPTPLPASIAASAPGRRIGDILAIPGLPPDLVMRMIGEVRSVGTMIVLEHDDRPLTPECRDIERTTKGINHEPAIAEMA